jgi:hypothetical protein
MHKSLALFFMAALACVVARSGEPSDSAVSRAKETEARFNELKVLATRGTFDEKTKAITQLAELESQVSDVEPFLVSLLKKDPLVQPQILLALASFKDKPRIAHLLLNLLKDHRELELPIGGSLIQMGDAARPAVVKALAAEEDEHRAGICLVYFASMPTLSLEGIPLSPDEKKRMTRALLRFLDPRIKFATVQATISKQEDLSYKTTAINLLALLGPDAREALPALEKMKDYEAGALKDPAQKALDKIQK